MKKTFKKDEICLITGSARFSIKEGTVSVVGAELGPGREVTVPEGKKVPLEVIEEAVVDIELKDSGNMETIPERTIPATWDDLVEKLLKRKIRVMLVLGEVDTGKTFFTTYVSNRLLSKDKKVAVLDCDTGQSDIGPPGTLGLALLEEGVPFLSEIEPSALYFTGSHSPSLHFLPSIVGVKRLVEKGAGSADIVIIDTPGWVQGDGGRALRRAEIEILSPDLVILLQREDELEHLVRNYPANFVERIHVSRKATSTSPDVRKGLRELLSEKYFSRSSKLSLSFKDFETDRVFWKTGKELDMKKNGCLWAEKLSGWEGAFVVAETVPSESQINDIKKSAGVFRLKVFASGEEKGTVVALLNADRDVLGLGIIDGIDFRSRKLDILTPLSSASDIKIVQFGSIKLTEKGKEAGFLEPGSL